MIFKILISDLLSILRPILHPLPFILDQRLIQFSISIFFLLAQKVILILALLATQTPSLLPAVAHADVDIDSDDLAVEFGAVQTINGHQCGTARVVLDEAEAAGRAFVLVEPHHQCFDAARHRELVDYLRFGRLECQVAHLDC